MDGWTLLIAAHAAAATLALLLGAVMVVRRPRGSAAHRRLGRVYLVCMYWVCLSSFGIQELTPGHFSWIHLLTIWTLISLTLGWRAGRQHRTHRHRRWLVGSYFGLIGAFLGAVTVPVRLVPQLVVQAPALAAAAVVGLGLLAAMVVRVTQAPRQPASPPAQSLAEV